MAKTLAAQIIPHLRLVGGTDFKGNSKGRAVRVPSASSQFIATEAEKGTLSARSTTDGWISLNACLPYDIAVAMMEIYVAAKA